MKPIPPPDNASLAIPAMEEPPPKRTGSSLVPLALTACVVLVVLAVIFPSMGKLREAAPRSVGRFNLRQIGQASLLYAFDHQDKLPAADDIWSYAAELARGGGLNDASIWSTVADPANEAMLGDLSTVLIGEKKLHPEFRALIPSWAVPLGEITTDMPASTPIAWTRGLRPDGTWASHGPNGTEGGHIVFLGGNVMFYRNLQIQGNALARFDGKGETVNILEALPPGTRIGEYMPNEAEQRAWAATRLSQARRQAFKATAIPMAGLGLWLTIFCVLVVKIIRRTSPRWVFAGFLLLTLCLLAMILPALGKVR